MNFEPLPQPLREGAPRCVGIEMEYAGLKIDEAALLIQEAFGGWRDPVNRFHQKIRDTRLGDFRLELDAKAVRDKTYVGYLKDLGLDVQRFDIQKEVDWVMEQMTTLFLPYELVAPPIPYDGLDELEELRGIFHRHKAKGTASSPVYAFGLHLNIETPDDTVDTWLRYIRSFFLLYPLFHKRMRIDLARRATPWIDRFPPEYVGRVLERSYRPTREEFMEDYYRFNPTRNRPLDFYSIFAHAFGPDHPLIKEVALVKPRPTFHYRLPNCEIDDPNWRLATEWNRWVMLERLAHDTERQHEWAQHFLEMNRDSWFGFNEKWIKWTQEKLSQEGGLA